MADGAAVGDTDSGPSKQGVLEIWYCPLFILLNYIEWRGRLNPLPINTPAAWVKCPIAPVTRMIEMVLLNMVKYRRDSKWYDPQDQ